MQDECTSGSLKPPPVWVVQSASAWSRGDAPGWGLWLCQCCQMRAAPVGPGSSKNSPHSQGMCSSSLVLCRQGLGSTVQAMTGMG